MVLATVAGGAETMFTSYGGERLRFLNGAG